MRWQTETGSVFAFYLALYLCLLTPMHLLHLDSQHISCDRFAQSCDDSCHDTPHHSGSCPTCQLGNGLIDLPIEAGFTSAVAPISIVCVTETADVSSWDSDRPSPRAPPLCA